MPMHEQAHLAKDDEVGRAKAHLVVKGALDGERLNLPYRERAKT